MRICVYCASSQHANPEYRQAARNLGILLAEAGCHIVYGGGGSGSMGALADGALQAGGEITGILPRFMDELEWGHSGLTCLQRVESMRERKQQMLLDTDAVVALPGGCGTLEELFEVITLKRLGLYFQPIILLDTRSYFTPLTEYLQHSIDEHFMNPEHAGMWQRVAQPQDVLPAIRGTPPWREDARSVAAVHPD